MVLLTSRYDTGNLLQDGGVGWKGAQQGVGGGQHGGRVRRPSQYTIYKHAVQKNVRESPRGLRALELNRDTSAELGAAYGWGGGHINPDSAIIGGSTHTHTRTCTALASQLCKMKEFLKGIIKIRGQLSKNAGEDRTFCMGRDKSNYYGTITGSITSPRDASRQIRSSV